MTPARTITDAEALDQIRDRYRTWGQEEIFEGCDSTIEFIGYVIEQTGRKTWFEEPGYLAESNPSRLSPSSDLSGGV
jgi:hypothetical protein